MVYLQKEVGMKIVRKYGYVRVSSKSQEFNSSIESQKQLLIQNGIEEQNILVEVGSAANEIKNRPVFQKLMNEKLQENDLLMVTKIDRCSRNTLGRFDLYFDRKYQTADKISVREFLDNCQKNLKQRNKNISLEKNNRGLVLKIGNRRSSNYSRIYQTKNSLRFEHEMKGKVLQQYYLLLVENRLEEFEQKLSSYFTLYFGKLLPLQHSYLDWLVIQLRPMRKESCLQSALKSDYIKSEIKSDSRKFVMLIQFLNYVQHLDFEIKSIDQISYRVVGFRLQDFLRFQNKYNNQYQLRKVKQFFEEVQTGILLTSFSDKYFQSLVAIPLVKFHKIQKFWVGRVWLAEELFYYKYPFLLPDFLKLNLQKISSKFELKL
jgi:Resolvase, N terminal domain